MFTPLRSLLLPTLRKIGLGREALAAQVCEKYRRIAPQLIHNEICAHTFPRFFKNGALTIGVEDSNWAHVITVRKAELLLALNEALKGAVVKKITTTVAYKRGVESTLV